MCAETVHRPSVLHTFQPSNGNHIETYQIFYVVNGRVVAVVDEVEAGDGPGALLHRHCLSTVTLAIRARLGV